MKVSIFTPTHNTKYLRDAYNSIKNQEIYEWVIVTNNGAKVQADIANDPRVKVVEHESSYVGALKNYACSQCTGDILLELDHDDMLTPAAIEEVKRAFVDEHIGFVYSDAVRFTGMFEDTGAFSGAHGWQTYSVNIQGKSLTVNKAFEATPQSVSKIWYAPDHLRAWRKTVYDKIGGHSADMRVLDDQELLCRTFIATNFKYIPKCLYMYRITGNNTWLTYNDEIQNNVMRISNIYLEQMALKWSKDKQLVSLDLGGRFNSPDGYKTVDLKDADFICDLNDTWNLDDNSVGVIRAYDIFEHLKDPLHTMKELYRVLAPGGYAFIQVPSTDGRGAFQDPTHVSYWNENSFLYYTDYNWAKYIDTPVRFMAESLYTTEKDAYGVCWTKATLIALKDDNRPPGLVKI